MTDLPILYYKGKGGALYQWRVWVEGATILTEYGQVGGQLQRTQGKTATPKNQGRANATTAEQQAELEASAMHTFKLERKYRLTPDAAEEQLFLPMLAHPIEKVKTKDLVFPGSVQPKLDGVRCIASWDGDDIRLMSRSGKPYSVPFVENDLRLILPKGCVFDGELYAHGLSCQTITSLVKRDQEGSRKLFYYVYDIPVVDGDDSLLWADRLLALEQRVPTSHILGGSVIRVPTVQVTTYDEILDHQAAFIENGYEGAMFRMLAGPYAWGYRSKHLLKVKTFQDGEFEVVGAREGQGKMAGCVVWLCRNDLTDATFECSHACTMEERARYFQEHAQYVGRKLTVKFFDRTEDKLPRFPVGKLFRPIEDLPKEN